MANGSGIWGVVRDWVFLVLSALGVLVMSLFRWNWNKMGEEVAQNRQAIKALVDEKASKEEVEQKHRENQAALKKLVEANEHADSIRVKMWDSLAAIDKNVGILLDRDTRKP